MELAEALTASKLIEAARLIELRTQEQLWQDEGESKIDRGLHLNPSEAF